MVVLRQARPVVQVVVVVVELTILMVLVTWVRLEQ
jgi:hypothetical protein